MDILRLVKKAEQAKEQNAFNEMVQNGGNLVAYGKAKYMGGYSAILKETDGSLAVNYAGIFFQSAKGGQYFQLPMKNIMQAGFKTGEQVAQNPVFARILALGGFAFAYRPKSRAKHMFLTVDYVLDGMESTILFETETANIFASAILKIKKEALEKEQQLAQAAGVEPQRPVSELMREINELYALGILTIQEFTEKKKDLLSRI